MATDFLHGVEVVTIDRGPRPIQTVRSAVIGLIGTAPEADSTAFPLDTPVLVNSRANYASIGATGTLKGALDGIFDQFSPFVVVIRVEEGEDEVETIANVLGGVDAGTGAFTGIQAFRAAETETGLQPMLLIAPGFTAERPAGITAVNVTNQGTGYTSAPTVTFSGGGTDPDKVLPTATAVLGTGANAGKVVSITITSAGRGLTAAPTVAFSGGGGGTGAAATAVIGAAPNPVVSALLPLADQFRATILADGPSTTDAAALAYRNDFGSRRVFIIDPAVKIYDAATGIYTPAPASPRVAGLIARIDHEVGFWKSPSNEVVYGIGGVERPIDWALGNPNTRANLLNENEIATFIKDEGWRLWGNRTASSDALYAFLSVSRTKDMVDLSIQRAHRYAVDQVINKAYYDDVVASVNGYLRQLQARGAILGGRCWVDPSKNTDADIQAGHATFSYDFTPPTPAERVTFESSIVSDYVINIFG
jgi:phage tail sheath protein FI